MESKEEIISKKLKGENLSFNEIKKIISSLSSGKLSEQEVENFVKGIEDNGMTIKETAALTRAMAESGRTIHWKNKIVADKHCIGGIPGNRTTPIVVSICAAAGLTIPKTSSRSITSAAGTADVMEVLTHVSIPDSKLKKIVEKTGACLAWGGELGLAPADEKLIKVERRLNIDPGPQIVASILCKKLAAGSNHILIDIPVGRGAKFSLKGGKKLAFYFMKIAKEFNLKLDIVFTDGSHPIGNGVGPVLEILEVLSVLKCEGSVPELEKKSIFLSSKLLELTGRARKGEGEILAKQMLYSGLALEKFNEIIKAQGAVKNPILKPGKFNSRIVARKNGKMKLFNNKQINSLGKILGCPNHKRAGIFIHKRTGEKVKQGEKILTLYAENKQMLENGKKFLKSNEIFSIK